MPAANCTKTRGKSPRALASPKCPIRVGERQAGLEGHQYVAVLRWTKVTGGRVASPKAKKAPVRKAPAKKAEPTIQPPKPAAPPRKPPTVRKDSPKTAKKATVSAHDFAMQPYLASAQALNYYVEQSEPLLERLPSAAALEAFARVLTRFRTDLFADDTFSHDVALFASLDALISAVGTADAGQIVRQITTLKTVLNTAFEVKLPVIHKNTVVSLANIERTLNEVYQILANGPVMHAKVDYALCSDLMHKVAVALDTPEGDQPASVLAHAIADDVREQLDIAKNLDLMNELVNMIGYILDRQ
jgi:hypothetical protein